MFNRRYSLPAIINQSFERGAGWNFFFVYRRHSRITVSSSEPARLVWLFDGRQDADFGGRVETMKTKPTKRRKRQTRCCERPGWRKTALVASRVGKLACLINIKQVDSVSLLAFPFLFSPSPHLPLCFLSVRFFSRFPPTGRFDCPVPGGRTRPLVHRATVVECTPSRTINLPHGVARSPASFTGVVCGRSSTNGIGFAGSDTIVYVRAHILAG